MRGKTLPLAECWREEFPILSRCVYLLSNALGATPRGVSSMLERYAQELFAMGEAGWAVWHPWLLEAADRVGKLIGAPAGTVVFDSSVTTFQHRIASCLDFDGPRRRVVMTSLDFPSVGYAWQSWSRYGAERIVVQSDDGITVSTERLIDAIDDTTAAVTMSMATYCSGALFDIRAVADRAHAVGALMVVDAFQAFGVVPIDVLALDVDVLMSGTRKFAMGSGESAFMYIRKELIGQLRPIMIGWAAHRDPFAFAPDLDLADGIERFQTGTPLILPHYVASVGWGILEEIGLETIRHQSLELTERIINCADSLSLNVATPRNPAERAGIVCLKFDGAERVAEDLNERGYLCSHRPASGLRLAPHFYNTLDEIDDFMTALADAIGAKT